MTLITTTFWPRAVWKRLAPQPGVPGGKLIGLQQALVLGDVGDDLALVPDVVAGGDAVDAGLVQLGADLGGDAEARRRVLAVDRHEIETEFAPQARDFLDHRIAAGPADDVTAEQDLHT